jgi:hypothetical protein
MRPTGERKKKPFTTTLSKFASAMRPPRNTKEKNFKIFGTIQFDPHPSQTPPESDLRAPKNGENSEVLNSEVLRPGGVTSLRCARFARCARGAPFIIGMAGLHLTMCVKICIILLTKSLLYGRKSALHAVLPITGTSYRGVIFI